MAGDDSHARGPEPGGRLTPIGDAVTRLGEGEGLDVLVTDEKVVKAEGRVELGKGVEVGGQVQHAPDAGWGWFLFGRWRRRK